MTSLFFPRWLTPAVGFLGMVAIAGCGGSSSAPPSKPAAVAPASDPDATVPATKPAVAPKPIASPATSADNLKRIGLGIHGFNDTYKRWPAATMTDNLGKAVSLSWRVTILPNLGEKKLYDEFKLDEPWDSVHNKTLIPKMPAIYAPAAVGGPGETYYQVFVGPGTVFEPRKMPKLSDMKDGTTNTVMVVEAGTPVVWTKPDDLLFDPAKDLPKLGEIPGGEFNVLMCDGSVHRAKKDFDPAEFKKAVTRAGRETIEFDKIWK